MKKVFTLIFPIVIVCASAVDLYAQTSGTKPPINIYSYLAPLTVALIFSELIYLRVTRKNLLSFQESIANLGTALGNQTMNLLIAAGVYSIYGYLWTNYRVTSIELNVYTFALLLILMDFLSYWVHRWGHAINVLWAVHSPHHSAEEMNIFVGLRASVTQRIFTFAVLWPLTIIGFTPFDIYLVNGLHLFIALFQHVTWTGKTERIGIVFNTPSHHRVHHAVNRKYLDKNFSDFLIIWDKLFGTFEPERETCVYGMYDPPRSWNPFVINFHYFRVLWRDARKTKFIADKFKVWFMPSGWRPRDLPPFDHEEITETNQARYLSPMFGGAKTYLILQAITAIPFTVFIITPETGLSTAARWIGGALLWMQIFNWGGIMESRKWVWVSEVIRILSSLVFVIWIASPVQMAPVAAVSAALAAFSIFWTFVYFRTNSRIVVAES